MGQPGDIFSQSYLLNSTCFAKQRQASLWAASSFHLYIESNKCQIWRQSGRKGFSAICKRTTHLENFQKFSFERLHTWAFCFMVKQALDHSKSSHEICSWGTEAEISLGVLALGNIWRRARDGLGFQGIICISDELAALHSVMVSYKVWPLGAKYWQTMIHIVWWCIFLSSAIGHCWPQETVADEAHVQAKGIAPTPQTAIIKFPTRTLSADLPALRWRWAL